MLISTILIFSCQIRLYFFQVFLSGSDDNKLRIWNGVLLQLQLGTFGNQIEEIDYDKENKLILAGSRSGKALIWNYTTKTFIHEIDIKQEVRSIVSVNETHFVAGLQSSVVFISKVQFTSQSFPLNNEDIKKIKILKNDKKLLIASLSKIFVFCLNTKTILKETNIGVEVWSLDVLNQNHIAAPCSSNWICIYKLNSDNHLVEIKNSTSNFNSRENDIKRLIFAIKIVNENLIVFGSTEKFLGVWDLIKDSITTYTSLELIISTEKISNDEIVYGTLNGIVYRVKLSQISNYEAINTQNFVKVYALKSISCTEDLAALKDETTIETTKTQSLSSSFIDYVTTKTTELVTTSKTDIKNVLNGSYYYDSSTSSIDFSNYSATEEITTSSDSTITNLKTMYANASIINNETKDLISVTTSFNIDLYNSTSYFINTFSTTPFKNNTTSTKNYISFDNFELVMDILDKDIDINDCLKNCSGNGKCKQVNSTKYLCECFENYAGSSCQLNTIPCLSNPCRNNGTCRENLINKTYSCDCYSTNNQTSLFYGQNCENKIDVCLNETCSKNGVCNDEISEAICKCFKGYSGEKCEVESNDIKTIKAMTRTASIIAIIVLILSFAIVMGIDVSNFFCKNSTRKKNFNKVIITKIQYKN